MGTLKEWKVGEIRQYIGYATRNYLRQVLIKQCAEDGIDPCFTYSKVKDRVFNVRREPTPCNLMTHHKYEAEQYSRAMMQRVYLAFKHQTKLEETIVREAHLYAKFRGVDYKTGRALIRKALRRVVESGNNLTFPTWLKQSWFPSGNIPVQHIWEGRFKYEEMVWP